MNEINNSFLYRFKVMEKMGISKRIKGINDYETEQEIKGIVNDLINCYEQYNFDIDDLLGEIKKVIYNYYN